MSQICLELHLTTAQFYVLQCRVKAGLGELGRAMLNVG
jgi:hypothetical protein